MHNDYVRTDGQWPPESVPTSRDWATFDRAQSKGLTLQGGLTYAPSSPIVLGGAGVTFSGSWLRGAVRTESGGRLVLGDSDYPLVESAQARSILLLFGLDLRSNLLVDDQKHQMSRAPFGAHFTEVDTTSLTWPIPPRAMHDGATLASAILRFRVGQAHSGVPGFMPRFTIRRLPLGHGSTAYLAAGGSVESAGGATLSPTPADANAYYSNGAVQAITLTCNANNVIDAGAYSYVVELMDELSTNALPGNVFHSLELRFSNINDMRPE
jgi:hypothetical protein